MSSNISQIVQVTISQQTQSVPQAGFGIPLIVGDSNKFSELVRYYTSPTAMLADGFLTTDPEYIHAAKAFSQDLSPEQVGIGKSDFSDIAADLAAIQAVSDLWYAVVLTDKSKAVIEAAAAYVETQKKILVAASSDSDIITSANTDLASDLKNASYKRTAVLYSANASSGPDAAWVGGQLPQIPGSSTWKFKTLVGVSPDDLTQSQRNYAIGTPGNPGKNANIYESVGGVPITEEGTMASGDFIDVVIGLDWLESNLQTAVFQVLASLPKVPYTDQGVALILNAINSVLRQGVRNGLIDGKSPIEVTAPNVLDVPVIDRANRFLPDVKFSCRLAGAIHFVQIQGVVTV